MSDFTQIENHHRKRISPRKRDQTPKLAFEAKVEIFEKPPTEESRFKRSYSVEPRGGNLQGNTIVL